MGLNLHEINDDCWGECVCFSRFSLVRNWAVALRWLHVAGRISFAISMCFERQSTRSHRSPSHCIGNQIVWKSTFDCARIKGEQNTRRQTAAVLRNFGDFITFHFNLVIKHLKFFTETLQNGCCLALLPSTKLVFSMWLWVFSFSLTTTHSSKWGQAFVCNGTISSVRNRNVKMLVLCWNRMGINNVRWFIQSSWCVCFLNSNAEKFCDYLC